MTKSRHERWGTDGVAAAGSPEWYRRMHEIGNTMRGIIARPHIPQSASMIPPAKENRPVTKGDWTAPLSRPRGPGWGPTPEDEHAARAREKERVRQQQERENAEMESRVAGDDSDKVQSEYNPFSREQMKK